MSEEWRAVPGFEGAYEVSDQGRVRSLTRQITQAGRNGTVYTKTVQGRMLRPGPHGSGHVTVMLGRAGGSRLVHALVLAAFAGPYPAGAEIRHLNGNPTDNRRSNLEYSTRGRNSQDKKWHNGARNYVLKPAQVSVIKARLRRGDRPAQIAPDFNIARSTVYAIEEGRFHRDVA